MKQRVIGIGGIFFKSEDPAKLYEWYEKHLDIKREPDGTGVTFRCRELAGGDGMTVWAPFPQLTACIL